MTVTAQTPITSATGNGVTTAFAFNFYAAAAADLLVEIDGVAKTLNVDYTVTGAGNPAGGTVTFTAPPASGARVVISRQTSESRSTDYQTAGDFRANPTVNLDFDRPWLRLQEISAKLLRGLFAPRGETLTELPASGTRANKVLAFDSSGAPSVLVPSDGSAASVLIDLADTANPAKNASLVGFKGDGAGAVSRTVRDKLAEFVSVTDFGAVGDWNGSSGTDNLPAFNAAITHLKSIGGGTLYIPAASGGYWLNGIWDLDDCRAITIKMPGRPANLDVESLSGARLVFTSASHCVRFDRCEHVNLDGVVIDCNNVANNGVVVRRLYNSEWRRVIVYRNAAAGFRFEGDPIGLNPDAGNVGNTFIEMACRGVRGMELVGATGGSWHNTYINTRIDYTGAEGLRLEQCDNCTFIHTYFFRRSGVGPGVRWAYPGSGLGPNSIYFYHLQGEIAIDPNVLYPGAVYGFDQSNGQQWPTIPNNIEFAITANGLNAAGWQINKRVVTRSINPWRSDTADGEAVRDDNGFGKRVWNGLNGASYRERLNPSTRLFEIGYSFDGSAEVVPFILDANHAFFPRATTTASAANAFLDNANNNRLMRSTSSAQYKTQVEDVEPQFSEAVLRLRPVYYRSTADADRKDWSYWGLIAEEVAEVDPRLVQWTYKDEDYELVTELDRNGKPFVLRKPKQGARPVPDGVAYERLPVLMLPILKKQREQIERLTARLAALEAAR